MGSHSRQGEGGKWGGWEDAEVRGERNEERNKMGEGWVGGKEEVEGEERRGKRGGD